MHFDELSKLDLDIFFSKEETYPAIWTVKGVEAVPIDVLFDETYEAVDPDTEAVIMSTEPRIVCRNDELHLDADESDVVDVKGGRFKVIEIQPEGLTSKVYLHREVS